MGAPAAAAASKAGSSAAIQAAAAAAAPAIGSVFGLIGAKKRMKLQNKYNMQLAAYQNDLNLAQWERENEYNSPINQMARLKEAGINPRMAYGDSASSQAASSPNMVAGAMQAPTNLGESMQTAFGQFQSVFNQMNQIQAMQAEIRNKDAQTAMYNSMTNVNEITSRLKALEEIMKSKQNYYYDMDKRTSLQFKRWAMTNMIASYYDKYGVPAVDYENSPAGSMPFANPVNFEGLEPMNLLDRKTVAAQIALSNAKRYEALASGRNKSFGIDFMKRRMRSMDLIDHATKLMNRLTYHKGNTEMERQNNMLAQRALMDMQKGLIEEQTEMLREQRLDFVPFVGNVSNYTNLLGGNYFKSFRFLPKYY